ncbi:hypothetical protein TNCV_4129651 [Trichonephila clavipes]|nr:hypothetical protein TNCV_4129651 [Trichonephila clavipes]
MNLRSSQLMGDLPPIRFQQIRPFESTGLDFAGPLTTKCAHKRKCSTLLILIEACLNSRPLTELSPDLRPTSRIDSSPLLSGEVLFISFQNHLSPQGL